MRLATLRDGTGDGALVEVSSDGARCRAMDPGTARAWFAADGAAPAGDWQPFDPAACMAPLPRAAAFLDASAYVNHVALVRKARGAQMPEAFWSDPLMYQGHADPLFGPGDPFPADPDWGIDCEAEIAVITAAVPMGASRGTALAAIRAVTLCNDWSLRALIPGELSKGFGFLQSKPPSAFAPFMLPPDDVPGWRDGKMHGTLRIDARGAPLGRVEAGEDMTFDFGTLVAHAARTRPLAPGSIVGSGTVSNRGADGGPGRPVAEGGRGYACIAEQRMVETIRGGGPSTPFLRPGDRVRIWMEDASGASIFGDIDQEVAAA